MSNHKLLFYGTEESETDDHELICYQNQNDHIFICIEMPDFPPSFIALDKSTAIKFSKTLRTEINKIENNG